MNSSLNPIVFALRHPITMMAAVAALVVGSFLAVQRMAVDVFPALAAILLPYSLKAAASKQSPLTDSIPARQ